jgi:hypothetical protein
MDEPRFPGYRLSKSCSGRADPARQQRMRVTPSSRTTFAELDYRSAQMAARLVKAEVVKRRNAGYCTLPVSATSGSAAWTRVRTSRQGRRCRGCIPGLLHDQLRVFGPHHRDTLETWLELAERGGQSGDITGAITELRQLLTDQQRVLGSGHRLALTIRAHLTRWEELPALQDRR